MRTTRQNPLRGCLFAAATLFTLFVVCGLMAYGALTLPQALQRRNWKTETLAAQRFDIVAATHEKLEGEKDAEGNLQTFTREVPGFSVRGVFSVRGTNDQRLSPQVTLLAFTTSREKAERVAARFHGPVQISFDPDNGEAALGEAPPLRWKQLSLGLGILILWLISWGRIRRNQPKPKEF